MKKRLVFVALVCAAPFCAFATSVDDAIPAIETPIVQTSQLEQERTKLYSELIALAGLIAETYKPQTPDPERVRVLESIFNEKLERLTVIEKELFNSFVQGLTGKWEQEFNPIKDHVAQISEARSQWIRLREQLDLFVQISATKWAGVRDQIAKDWQEVSRKLRQSQEELEKIWHP